jgi:hypothetical protein
MVTICTVERLELERWDALHTAHLSGAYMPGHYGWFLAEPLRFLEPIPGPGGQRLFVPGTELQHQLIAARDATL